MCSSSSLPPPVDQGGRLDAVRRLGLVDAPAEASFDRLTRLVCTLINVPVAAVTLVEEDRQFFLSAIGLPDHTLAVRQTPLSHSFCKYVVAAGAPVVIDNTRADPRVAHNGAVEDFDVAAYLGIPLRSADGYVLGALAAMDHRPRLWTAAEQSAMADLADVTGTELELRSLARNLDLRMQEEIRARQTAQDEVARKRRLEALGQLAGGIAHDFANVLQAVQGGIRIASQNLERDPAKARRVLQATSDAAQRGGAITRRLLGFARRGELRVQAVDIGTVLADLDDVLIHTLNRPGLAVRIEAEPDLPRVRVDRGELEAVLINLATNARDAMPSGGCITLGASLAPGPAAEAGDSAGAAHHVRLSVADDGVGMPAETLARATEPFFTTKAEGAGTGLGLTMARDFAAQAGGSFLLESEVGRGTVVTLCLPPIPADAGEGA